MYLEGLDVLGRPGCTWKAWMYLEGNKKAAVSPQRLWIQKLMSVLVVSLELSEQLQDLEEQADYLVSAFM